MKIRFGVGLGAGPDTGPGELAHVVDRLESEGIDSLWFSELVYTDAIDPFIGMAFALARTTKLKVGTSVVVLPGRHPVLVAKQLASLAALAPKRVLPVFGLRSAVPAERDVFAVPDGQRAAVFDESLRLLRFALESDGDDFSGNYFSVASVAVAPRPANPLDLWLGGSAPAAFRRIGGLADGWLGSFLTPEEARRGREAIEVAPAEAGRLIEPDHFGINIAVSENGLPDDVLAGVRHRRPDVDPTELVADGWDGLTRMIDAYVEAGLTKFVIRPVGGDGLDPFIDRFVEHLLPLRTDRANRKESYMRSETSQVVVAGHLIVRPDQRDDYLAGCVEVVRQARAAPGCLDFTISADLLDPGRINVFERWKAQAAVEAFRGTGTSDEQAAAILDASVSEYDVASERSLS